MAKLSLPQLKRFFTYTIWHVKLQEFPSWQRNGIKMLRISILAVKDFIRKDLSLQASALTLFTLLSIVPVVALVFGIAKGFGLEAYLNQELNKVLGHQPDVLNNVMSYAHNMLANTKGGIIAGFGFLLLLWSVLQVIGNIEDAFNSIWHVQESRTIIRKFTDYLSIMLVAPLFIIVSGAVTIYLSTQIPSLLASLSFFSSEVINLIVISLKIVPYITTILLFYFVYQVIPNTRVKPKSAFTAAIIAGCVFQLFQWAYIAFQVGVSRYNAIYGSFASIPLFITWLQFGWMIVLIGAEISYSMQNIEVFESEQKTGKISHKMRMLYSLCIMHHIAKAFKHAENPPEAITLANAVEIPLSLCKQLLVTMQKANLVVQTLKNEKSKEYSYLPAVDVSHLSISFIINKLESVGELKRLGKNDKLIHHIKVKYLALEAAMDNAPDNKNILDIY